MYYGPFKRLPRDSQELSLCCLYYFSNLDSPLLQSIASCCLCKYYMSISSNIDELDCIGILFLIGNRQNFVKNESS